MVGGNVEKLGEVIVREPLGGINMLIVGNVKKLKELGRMAGITKGVGVMPTDEIMGICKGKIGEHSPYTLVWNNGSISYREGEVKPLPQGYTESEEGVPFGLPIVSCPKCHNYGAFSYKHGGD